MYYTFLLTFLYSGVDISVLYQYLFYFVLFYFALGTPMNWICRHIGLVYPTYTNATGQPSESRSRRGQQRLDLGHLLDSDCCAVRPHFCTTPY